METRSASSTRPDVQIISIGNRDELEKKNFTKANKIMKILIRLDSR